jgi:hypothetical protein
MRFKHDNGLHHHHHRHSTPLAGKKGTKACHECETLHIRPKLGGMGFKYYNTDYIQKLNKLDVWKWWKLGGRGRKIKSELHRMWSRGGSDITPLVQYIYGKYTCQISA